MHRYDFRVMGEPDGNKQRVLAAARAAGFDAVGVTTPLRIDAGIGQRLAEFLRQGRHGDMQWMASTAERRRHPASLWPRVRSIIMLGMNYVPARDPLAVLAERNRGAISCYAQSMDYHTVIKSALRQVAASLPPGTEAKIFVDTAPLMEKPLAEAAGLGWQGKHTNLVSRTFGSWLLLGALLTTAELEADAAESDHCGSCRNCLDVCPTQAFPAPYQLDARRCISYLTIEHKGHIPSALRTAIGNRVFGCDDCLAVCPWNKFAAAGRESRLAAHPGTDCPPLAELLALDEAHFRERFAGTPLRRTGRDRVVRNALIAAGNSGDVSLVPAGQRLLGDGSSLVRAMAVWALQRLLPEATFRRLRSEHVGREADPDVLAEWGSSH
jgi:epoxyqueuosine reductase